MTKQTTTTLIVASLYFTVFLALLVYAYISVRAEQVRYQELTTTLATEAAKQAVAHQITEVSSRTVAERAELQHYFVTEKETISFITEIESLARSIGVTLETTSLDLTPATGKDPAILKTGFLVKGSQTDVTTFLQMMESLPYHSRIPTMDISRLGSNEWQGSLSLEVTVRP
jgi:phenylpyruvate tautomerase PptA (4-oxalocrotonate tautomerase family)